MGARRHVHLATAVGDNWGIDGVKHDERDATDLARKPGAWPTTGSPHRPYPEIRELVRYGCFMIGLSTRAWARSTRHGETASCPESKTREDRPATPTSTAWSSHLLDAGGGDLRSVRSSAAGQIRTQEVHLPKLR